MSYLLRTYIMCIYVHVLFTQRTMYNERKRDTHVELNPILPEKCIYICGHVPAAMAFPITIWLK